MPFETTILMSDVVTHDVKRFIMTRPAGFDYMAGQGVELAIDNGQWREQGRPFTPTSLPTDPVLEFIIKAYPEHHGVTEQLHALRPGARLLLSEPFGTIRYRGPGTFIAAGAGITPFLAILRQLAEEQRLEGHQLLYANKRPADIIHEAGLRHWLGEQVHFFCSREGDCRCQTGRIDREVLERLINDFGQRFYVCGPPPFTGAVNEALYTLGAQVESVVFEQ